MIQRDRRQLRVRISARQQPRLVERHAALERHALERLQRAVAPLTPSEVGGALRELARVVSLHDLDGRIVAGSNSGVDVDEGARREGDGVRAGGVHARDGGGVGDEGGREAEGGDFAGVDEARVGDDEGGEGSDNGRAGGGGWGREGGDGGWGGEGGEIEGAVGRRRHFGGCLVGWGI